MKERWMRKVDTYENLVEEYKECAKIHYNIDYTDKNSVKHGHNAARTMIDIARTINNKYSERIEEFSKLLYDKNYKINIWAAHHILEHMNYTHDLECSALSIIKKYAKKNTIEGLGNKMWLEQWTKNKK